MIRRHVARLGERLCESVDDWFMFQRILSLPIHDLGAGAKPLIALFSIQAENSLEINPGKSPFPDSQK